MKILIDKSFVRDAKRLPVGVQSQLKSLLGKIIVATSLQELDAIKMKGDPNAYRVRFGNYRIGFYLEEGQVVLSRVLDRKEIYRYFPKK
jgi:mRNA interferase RelE/StbE